MFRTKSIRTRKAVRRQTISQAAYQSLEQLESRTLFNVAVNGGVPQLSSNPSAHVKIYLDFDGAPATSWQGYNVPTTPAYDSDGDPTTFSSTELNVITQTWSRVAEKFSPFNVDVTTTDPGTYADCTALHVIIGGTGSWTGLMVAGAAQWNSFYDTTEVNSAYAFNSSSFGMGEAIVHEAGTTFGLQQQSNGNSQTPNMGTVNYAPVMGNSVSSRRGLWWNGNVLFWYDPTTGQTTTQSQDDLSVLDGKFGRRTDGVGSSISGATALASNAGTFSGNGIISALSQTDFFSFNTTGGSVTINVNGNQYGQMLNPYFKLYNSSGTLLATADNSSTLNNTLTQTLGSGTYYISVAGHGSLVCTDSTGANLGTGDDIGQFSVSVSAPSGTVTAPAAPSSLSASTASSSQINLSWIDNSTNESNYVVDQATDSGFTQSFSSFTLGAGSTSYSATGLLSGATYYYRVRATNSAGASANSNTAFATTQSVVTIPAAPSSLSASTVSSGQINLSWFDNSNNENNFLVDRATDSGFTQNFSTATLGANTTSFSETGLNSGTTYYFRVHASNGAGSSSNSNTAFATTQTIVTAPNAPSGLAASAASGSQINLTWFDNSSNESNFVVDRATDTGFTQNLSTATLGTNTTSYSATGLSSGMTYYFRVRATNSAGSSANSNTASAVTPNVVTLPAAPSNLTASTVSSSVINLTWADNSTNETGFTIDRATDSGFTQNFSSVNLGAGYSFLSESGLNASTTYYFRVRATNSAGSSGYSNTAFGTTQSNSTAPAAPSNLTASGSVASVLLSWFDNSSNESGFVVQRSTDGVNFSNLVTLGAGASSFSDSSIGSGTTYTYRVYAYNSSGNSGTSNNASILAIPSAPTGLVASAASSSQINLSWNDVSGETGYRLDRSTDGVNWTTAANLSSGTRSYTDGLLAPSTTYWYRVVADGLSGNSPASNSASATTSSAASLIPAAPSNVNDSYNIARKEYAISWDDNSSNESGFIVQYTTDGVNWYTLATVPSNSTSYVLSARRGTYTFRVAAFNSSGQSAWAM